MHIYRLLGCHLSSCLESMLALVEYTATTINKGGAHDKAGDKATGPAPYANIRPKHSCREQYKCSHINEFATMNTCQLKVDKSAMKIPSNG